MSSQTSQATGKQRNIVFITGGTGFVGSKVVEAIRRDHQVRLLVRPGSRPSTPAGVDLVEGDVTDRESLRGQMDGCDTVVHLVGIIEENGASTFDSVIHKGTQHVVAEAKEADVTRFIHMSALGAQQNPEYGYHTAKFESEEVVKTSGLDFTIFRPSVIFGKGDGFITVLAGVVKSFPLIPIVGSGKAKFQPVQIDDVAESFSRAVNDPIGTSNKTYELGGARPYTYEQMIDTIAAKVGKKKPKIHVPLPLMKVAVKFSEPLPKALRPPVTSEQLKMLSLDNSTEHSATGDLLGRGPVALENGIDYLLPN